MAYAFGSSSRKHLAGVHPDLVKVAERALQLSKYDFSITDGLRTHDEQVKLVAEGKSKTMNSRHLPNEQGVSEAFDFAPYINGRISWDKKYFRKIVQAMITAAIELNIQIEFGGLWTSLEDWPHVQLK